VADPSTNLKTKFISFSIVGGGTNETAIRVRLMSLHVVVPPYTGGATVPFTAFNGQSVWVGPPTQYDESDVVGAPTFWSSSTQCTPHYRNWNTLGLLHVRGSAIVPSSTYRVEHVAATCMGHEGAPACNTGLEVSGELEIKTTRWGDVELPYAPPGGGAPGQPDFGDIGSLVSKFKDVAGAPIKARGLIAPSDLFGNINHATMDVALGFGHIAACVDAFGGDAYPAHMGKCFGAPTPPATGACTTDLQCTGTNGAPPCNLYCPP
jgi:hypothetical protein